MNTSSVSEKKKKQKVKKNERYINNAELNLAAMRHQFQQLKMEEKFYLM